MPPILQFFVSAPAASKARPYYKRDVLNLCCLPSGERLSLSYKRHWLDDDILNAAQQGSLRNFNTLVIFCEEEPTPTSIYNFYPIRFARTTTSNESADVRTFTLVLGDFCDYVTTLQPSIQIALTSESKAHPNYRRDPSGGRHPHAKFARIANSALTLSSAAGAWEGLVDKITALNGVKDSLFIISCDLEHEPTKPTPKSIMDSKCTTALHRPEVIIPRGAQREIELYVRAGKDAQFIPPNVSMLRDSVGNVSGPFVRQHQNGYACQYIIDFRQGWDKESTLLNIRSPKRKLDDNEFISPEFNVYVTAKPSGAMLALVVFLLSVGSLLTSLGPDSLAQIMPPQQQQVAATASQPTASSTQAVPSAPQASMSAKETPTTESARILFVACKIVGTLMVASGALLGFRKLPLK